MSAATIADSKAVMLPNDFVFHPGKTYPHLTGSYSVESVADDVLTCQMEDGRTIEISTAQAYRILEEVGYFSTSPSAPPRLSHDCVGQPCGSGCVKLHGSSRD